MIERRPLSFFLRCKAWEVWVTDALLAGPLRWEVDFPGYDGEMRTRRFATRAEAMAFLEREGAKPDLRLVK